MNMNINMPSLIEPGVKSFLGHTLKQCKNYKNKNLSIIYNIGYFLFFVIVIGIILKYKYRGGISSYEKDEKNRKKQEYIVSKLQQVSRINQSVLRQKNMITDLPNWDNHPEVGILNRKIYH
jgi:hypothetical protein